MSCLGRNFDDHCCYLAGKVCDFLEENTEPGFRWSCGLRRELGDWDKVLADPRYKPIGEFFIEVIGVDCKDFGSSKHPCTHCGGGE